VTDKQPKALWLADELEKYTYDFEWHSTAADELRRLHQSEREGWRYVGELEQERKRLSEVNAELVEAVKAALSDDQPYIEKCKAALVKATGENNG
jgi:hypothetical protein